MGDRKPPEGLQEAGQRLWRSVLGEYDLDTHEQLLLLQACRCADHLDRLAAEAALHPVMIETVKGDQAPHPSLVESRQQSITLSRLMASLRLPSGEEDDRPQRRGASRGSYGVRAVS